MDIKKIERLLWGVYNEMKEQFPGLEYISFSLSQHINENQLYGYYNVGENSKMFHDLAHLIRIIEEEKATRPNHEILFRQFTL